METLDPGPDRPDGDRIRVGTAEYVTAEDGETLAALGLGSGLAVAVYDPAAGGGALAHAVLPRREEGDGGPPAKYADAAVRATVTELADLGALPGRLEARLAGGARVADPGGPNAAVAPENVRAARAELSNLGIPVEGEAVGGDGRRTVAFDSYTGRLRVRTADGDPRPV